MNHSDPNQDLPGNQDIPGNVTHWVSLDVFRALAALAVFATHWAIGPYLWKPEIIGKTGRLGVDVFFILSGILIARTVLKPREFSRKKYMISRMRRVLPCYFAALLLITTVVKSDWLDTGNGLKIVLIHIPLLHAFWAEAVTAINSPFWTLSHEWCFYIFMALSASILRSGRVRWIVAFLIGLGFAYRLALANHWSAPGLNFFTPLGLFSPLGMLILFGIGVMGGAASLDPRIQILKNPKLAVFTAITGLALLLFAILRFHDSGEAWDSQRSMLLFFPFLFGLPVVTLLLLSMVWDKPLAKIFRWTPLPWIGMISYSLYIWHLPVMKSWSRATAHLPDDAAFRSPVLSSIGMIVAVLTVSAASFYFIEKPYLTRRQEARSS